MRAILLVLLLCGCASAGDLGEGLSSAGRAVSAKAHRNAPARIDPIGVSNIRPF